MRGRESVIGNRHGGGVRAHSPRKLRTVSLFEGGEYEVRAASNISSHFCPFLLLDWTPEAIIHFVSPAPRTAPGTKQLFITVI